MLDPPARPGRDDVLTQPTRARLFALLVDLRRSAGTAELATRLGLHPNGVRVHLERLRDAGLVARARAHARRGRPPDAWTIVPGARPGGDPPRAYRDLGRWLARSISSRSTSVGRLERTGRQIGRELAPHDATPGLEAMERALTRLGCEPRVASHRDDAVSLSLENCPYRDAVCENQPAICALHKGITTGLLDVLWPQTRLTRFVPHDPDEAGCEVQMTRLLAG